MIPKFCAKVLLFFDICKYFGRKNAKIIILHSILGKTKKNRPFATGDFRKERLNE